MKNGKHIYAGSEWWYKDGLVHREDGPAIIRPNGSEEWHRDGKFHREDGPAIIWADGSLSWYRDGLLHREDGPAVIWPSGSEGWYILGNPVDPFTPEEYPLILASLLDL